MLARFSGGSGGITEYLKTGAKKQSEFTRDELDSRLVLLGDIDILDKTINMMENKGDKYLHITLSFKEDYIEPEVMKQIVDSYLKTLMIAYDDDEYAAYAEAHLPKIKTVPHRLTGELIERKPHIHLVIPKLNLRTNQVLNPVRLHEMDQKYFDVIQEKINHAYGLASPRENKRVGVNHSEEVLSRWTAQNMKEGNRALKQELLQVILRDETVRDGESLIVALRRNGFDGDFRWRKSETDYLNIKLKDQAKGVNLKEYVFTKEFLALSIEDKQAALKSQIGGGSFAGETTHDQTQHVRAGSYLERNAAEQQNDDTPIYSEIYTVKDEGLLQRWLMQRSYELKYIDPKNTSFKKAYKELDDAQKQEALKAFRQINISKQKGNNHDEYQHSSKSLSRHASARRITESIIGRVRDFAKTIEYVNRFKLHNLSGRVVVREGGDLSRSPQKEQRNEQSAGMFLQGAKHGDLPSRVDQDSRLLGGRANDGRAAIIAKLETPANRLQEELRQGCLSEIEQAKSQTTEFDEISNIKQTVSLAVLMPHLEHLNIEVGKYKTLNYPDGQRIVCGNRKLTCSDFLTKELNLPWPQAREILNLAHSDVLEGRSRNYQSVARYDKKQWDEFVKSGSLTDESLQFNKLTTKNDNYLEIKNLQLSYKETRAAVIRGFGYASPQARQRLALLNLEKVTAMERLKERHRQEQAKQRLTRENLNNRYASFLSFKANTGDFLALKELQRIVKNNDIFARENAVSGKSSRSRIEFEGLKYRVGRYGDVTYSQSSNKEGRAQQSNIDLFTDKGARAVANDILIKDSAKMQVYVFYCLEKYGSRMEVNGSAAFKQSVEAAKQSILHEQSSKLER